MTDLPLQAMAFAQTLALEAASMVQQAARQSNAVEFKSPGDWCSAVDRRIEAHLHARIAQAYPQHGFLGEESATTRVTPGLLWVVDPLDGSMNFLRGYPQYSVSIALLSDAEPIAACIADPCRQEFFCAAAGHGAHLQGARLRVAATARMDEAIAATVFPKPQSAHLPHYLAQFGRVVAAAAGVRRSGSMALELAYLAAGRVDVFWSHGMGSWDAAAGVLLIREAGGQVFTLDGARWCDSPSLAAAAPGVADAWHALLQPHTRA
jgi:myo-inositol-1(or 4)-monophosphatase